MKGFYKGLDSALLRQAVYASARLGLYFNFVENLKKKNNGENLTFAQKTAASLAAGGLGSFVGNPCDLTLVRMQADSTLPESQRRNYKGVFDAFGTIIKEEGATSLWKGAVPTMMRAMALNAAMLVSYDTVKEMMTQKFGKDAQFKILFTSSMVSAVATAVVSLPFDNIKTKIQKQKVDPLTGKTPYSGVPDCFAKSIAREGITGLWAGLPTYYFRVGPHAIITLLTADFLKSKIMAK